VIGATCIIGNNVKLYQGVTLGAKSFPLDENGNPIKGIPRHPILEDDVIVYSNATILGRITIGKGAVVGGNIWVTEDVKPGARITQNRAKEIDNFTNYAI
ncbi:MAG: serine acetyltransferase, partial [Bacteroidaceae bacterium]|nr:serine acetyltransferase [Bacteroidaceae bacterium]